MADRFSWKTIPELATDNLPLLLIWGEDIKVESAHTRRRPNYPNADWPTFHKCLDNGIHEVSSVGFLFKRLEALCKLIKLAEAEAVPIKVFSKRDPLDECPNETAYSETQ